MSQFYRPLRPFFYKPVAILGVPLRDWKISLAATVCSAVILFFVWQRFYGIPIWFVLSLGIGFGMVTFFLWAHNSHKRGWLEFSLSYLWRNIIGAGQNLTAEKSGRKKTKWITDANDQKNNLKWLEGA